MARKKQGSKDNVSAKDPNEPTFEQAMKAVEKSVHDLEGGQLELGEALRVYEQGVTMIRRCHQLLQDAERQVELLMEVYEDGSVETQSFEAGQAESLTVKQEARSRRRSVSKEADVDSEGRLF